MSTSPNYTRGTPEQQHQTTAVTTLIARQMGRQHVYATVSNPPGGDFWEVGYVWKRLGVDAYGKEYSVTLARGKTFDDALEKARRKIKPE